MKIVFMTIGKPKLPYAILGVKEYLKRLQRLHDVSVIHLADKYAYNSAKIIEATRGTVIVALEINGKGYTSEQLAEFLEKRDLDSKTVTFLIGGPEGLPQDVKDRADYLWSVGKHTLPHDLAQVVVLEALYRASTIRAGLPYHK